VQKFFYYFKNTRIIGKNAQIFMRERALFSIELFKIEL
jgi:hypothetical protein